MLRLVLRRARGTLVVVGVLLITGFASSGRVSAQMPSGRIDTRRSPIAAADPMPFALGEQRLGVVRSAAAGLDAALTELQRWGWPMLNVNTHRMELRTDWLFLSDPALRPDNGSVCPQTANSGLRLVVLPRERTADSVVYVLRGDAYMAAGLDRRDAESKARASFQRVGDALRQALHAVAESTDTATAGLPGMRGEIGGGTASGRHGCTVVR